MKSQISNTEPHQNQENDGVFNWQNEGQQKIYDVVKDLFPHLNKTWLIVLSHLDIPKTYYAIAGELTKSPTYAHQILTGLVEAGIVISPSRMGKQRIIYEIHNDIKKKIYAWGKKEIENEKTTERES